MTTPSGGGFVAPAAAAAVAGAARSDADADDATSGTTEGGVPVGEADREADARQSGADVDDTAAVGEGLGVTDAGDAGAESDDGVPVGRADADADRARSGADDED